MPNSEPRPERVRQRGNNRDTYHPLRDQSKFMIPKDQSIPDVAQDTILIVYTAAKVNGGKMRGPNRGQNPHPWRNPGALAAINDVSQARANQNEEQVGRTRKHREQYA
jgi:hypothetical protein